MRKAPAGSRPSTALTVPRRLCYAIGGLALFGTVGCSDAMGPGRDARSDAPTDVVIADVVQDATVDLPADVPRDLAADRADLAGDASPADMRGEPRIVFTFECVPQDPMADPPPACPKGKLTTKEFPPECPEGCEPVGLG